MVAASRSRPRSRLHSPTETSRNEGASDGVSTPSISTVSSRPPASASAVQRIVVAVSTARRSVPVQSRRTSVVAVETRVSSPLMIGGNERTLVVGVDNQGEARGIRDEVGKGPPLRVALEHLLHAHRLLEVERDEPPVARRGEVPERGADTGEVVEADRDLPAAPAHGPVERLLQAHQRDDRLLVEGEATHHGRPEIRADLREARVDRERDAGGRGRVANRSLLETEEPAQRPRRPLRREEVGPVREELDVDVVLLAPLDVRAEHGQALDDRLARQPDEPLEVAVRERDDGHPQRLPRIGVSRIQSMSER